jgi:hypothetical protein
MKILLCLCAGLILIYLWLMDSCIAYIFLWDPFDIRLKYHIIFGDISGWFWFRNMTSSGSQHNVWQMDPLENWLLLKSDVKNYKGLRIKMSFSPTTCRAFCSIPSEDWRFFSPWFPATWARSRSSTNPAFYMDFFPLLDFSGSMGFGTWRIFVPLFWVTCRLFYFPFVLDYRTFLSVDFVYSVYPLSLWDKKGEYMLVLDRKCIFNPVKWFLSQNGQRGSLLGFLLAAFCWTKSFLCNVAAFTGMLFYSESTLQLWASRRLYAEFKSASTIPLHPSERRGIPSGRSSVKASSVRTTRTFHPNAHQCLETLNYSHLHLSGCFGKSSGRYSEFEKNLAFNCICLGDVTIPSEGHSVFDK